MLRSLSSVIDDALITSMPSLARGSAIHSMTFLFFFSFRCFSLFLPFLPRRVLSFLVLRVFLISLLAFFRYVFFRFLLFSLLFLHSFFFLFLFSNQIASVLRMRSN